MEIFYDFKEEEGRSVIIDTKDILENKYSISPKLYVKSVNEDSDTDDIIELIKRWDSSSENNNNELNKLTSILQHANS